MIFLFFNKWCFSFLSFLKTRKLNTISMLFILIQVIKTNFRLSEFIYIYIHYYFVVWIIVENNTQNGDFHKPSITVYVRDVCTIRNVRHSVVRSTNIVHSSVLLCWLTRWNTNETCTLPEGLSFETIGKPRVFSGLARLNSASAPLLGLIIRLLLFSS